MLDAFTAAVQLSFPLHKECRHAKTNFSDATSRLMVWYSKVSHKFVKLVRVRRLHEGADTKPIYCVVIILNEFKQVRGIVLVFNLAPQMENSMGRSTLT